MTNHDLAIEKYQMKNCNEFEPTDKERTIVVKKADFKFNDKNC